MIPTPPLDIRCGPISWQMHGGWMVCDWCNTILAPAGMTDTHIKKHHLHDPGLRRVWFPVSNRYQWICDQCNDLRFTEPKVGSWQPASFIVWANEHTACAAHGQGYHEPTVVLRHELGIYCSTGTHGWMVWTEASTAMIGEKCGAVAAIRNEHSPYCPGTWVAINRIVGYEDGNQWCRCGKPANAQNDGEGIFYDYFCDGCWNTPEFYHVRNYKYDYLDAGEYL